MDFPEPPDLHVERDADGSTRHLRHLHHPFVGSAEQSPRETALDYLKAATDRGYFSFSDQDFDELERTSGDPDPEPGEDARFRWIPFRELHSGGRVQTIVVGIQQTVPAARGALDLRGCGLRVLVHRQTDESAPSYVTQLNSTLRDSLTLGAAALNRLALVRSLDPKRIAGIIGWLLQIPDDGLIAFPWRLVAYFPDPRDRRDPRPPPPRDATTHWAAEESSELPASIMPPSRAPSVGLLIEYPRPNQNHELIPYRAILDIQLLQVTYQRALVASCTGFVFPSDPRSASGSARMSPDSPAARLNTMRRRVDLLELDAPDAAGDQMLSGRLVRVRTPNPIKVEPPKQPPPFDFDSRGRSHDDGSQDDHFAAVNAYFHCDRAFRMVEEFGLDLNTYFAPNQFPVNVLHRAPVIPGAGYNGRCINAQVLPVPHSNRVSEIRFALADLADQNNPLGLASDVRWVWHEFCHALLVAATGELEFKFAHSAGDALAAILCDPASAYADDNAVGGASGITFPFVMTPLRRHDRDPRLGWAWNGALYDPNLYPERRDPGGYRAEQILSSTLFRIYRAIGGDAMKTRSRPDRPTRHAAALAVAHLIVRAIGSLGAASAAAADASVFASAMMDADRFSSALADPLASAGTLIKVVRWAFEQQGLYGASPWPHNDAGSAEPVDIYLNDVADRRGEYDYVSGNKWHAHPASVWVRRNADNETADQRPRKNRPNYVYVLLENRGDTDAVPASVEVFAARGADIDVWQATSAKWASLGSPQQADVPAGGATRFGPFTWTPQGAGDHALLICARAAGDASNIDAASILPCAIGPVAVKGLVPFDNNLGYRSWRLS